MRKNIPPERRVDGERREVRTRELSEANRDRGSIGRFDVRSILINTIIDECDGASDR